MKYEDNPRSIKYHVKQYLRKNADVLKGKTIIDFPTGNGITSKLLKEVGANPIPMDLFTEYFELEDIECLRAEIRSGLPLDDH